jgi:hypothetical protein
MTDKTHYRKAFDSPYLSAADIVEPTTLTVARMALEIDKTKQSKEQFNTMYFVEKEIRPGEKLKPMVLNATNSRVMKQLTGSPYIEDWTGAQITVYVDSNVKFGRETVEGLRISPVPPAARKVAEKQPITDERLENAIKAILAKTTTIAALNARFTLTEEQEKKVQDAIANA